MVSVLAAAILGTLPLLSSVQAFAPLTLAPVSQSQRAHRSVTVAANGIRLHSTSTGEEDFDPFLQSPNSFGTNDDDDANSEQVGSPIGTASGTISTFGFLSYINEEEVVKDAESWLADDISAATANSDADDLEFDPLLSPHAYVDGADAAPTTTQTKTEQQREQQQQQTIPDPDLVESQEQEQQTSTSNTPNNSNVDVDMEFDPLLSPHAYANGVDSAPAVENADAESPFTVMATQRTTQQQQQKKKKLGILLIDHGSRRQASNEHIHNVASMYENQLNQKGSSSNTSASSNGTTTTTTTVVRAAHMEISAPSIIDSLRNIIAVDKVNKVVCVPYFLSPGRHATEDIPQLLAEAKELLREDGMECVDILMSEALGTHLESMLGAVDNLVEMTLNE